MRKIVALLVSALMVFQSASLAAPNSSSNTTESVHKENTGADTTNDFYFLYSDIEDSEWFLNYIGEHDCESEYLYVKNFTTGEITRVMDIPLKNFVRKEDIFYVVTMDDVFLKREADGSTKELYRFQHGGGIYDGEHDPVSYSDEGIIFMMDGDYVVRVDTATDEVETVTRCEQAEYLYIVDEQSFIWRDELKAYRLYTMESNRHVIVESVAAVMAEKYENEYAATATTASVSSPQNFPIPSYPVGSYFSVDGEECSACHRNNCQTTGGCDCRSYANSIQCMGFARYASDQYAHRTSWSEPTGDKVNYSFRRLVTADNAKSIFQELDVGTYVRMSDKSYSEKPNGTHSFVITGKTSAGISLYEANYTGKCKVGVRTLTYSALINEYPYILHTLEHQYTGSNVYHNSTHHKKNCSSSSCTAYRLQAHYAQTTGTGVTCLGCGYVGNIYIGLS